MRQTERPKTFQIQPLIANDNFEPPYGGAMFVGTKSITRSETVEREI